MMSSVDNSMNRLGPCTPEIRSAADRPGTMVGLALGAGLAEAATMLPYLGTIALLVGSGLGAWASGGLLGGYVLVMVLPALLLVLRLAVGRRWAPALQRLRDWVARSSAGTLSGWWPSSGCSWPATPSPTSLRSSTASVAEFDAPAAAATRCGTGPPPPPPAEPERNGELVSVAAPPLHNSTHVSGTYVSGTFIPVT